jgi:hypothetical protein
MLSTWQRAFHAQRQERFKDEFKKEEIPAVDVNAAS